jgi:hypothetical protein
MHVGSSSSVIRSTEPVELGESGSDLSAALRGYELGFQVQVPYALTLMGASVVTGDAHALELSDGAEAMLRSDSVTAWHGMVGLAVPLVEVKGVRLAPYATYSRRLMIPDELSIRSTTELGLQLLPREPWGFFGDEMRQGFTARVGMCWASGQFGDELSINPTFSGRGLLFALDYRLLFSEVEEWQL